MRTKVLVATLTMLGSATVWAAPVASEQAGELTLVDLQKLTRLVEQFPDQLAGVSTNTLSKITVHAVGVDPLPKVVANVAADLRRKGAKVDVRPAKYSMRQLRQIEEQIPDSAPFAAAPATLVRWGVNPEKNQVEVGVTQHPVGLKALFDDSVDLQIAQRIAPVGRFDDSPPLYGGNRITGGPAGVNCTSGFSVTTGSEVMQLTAGHCYELGATVSANTYLSKVGHRSFRSRGYDSELLVNIPGAPVYSGLSGRIWEGPVGNARVTDVADSCNGCQVYFGGSFTGKALATLKGYKTSIRRCLDVACDNWVTVIGVQEAIGVGGANICVHGDSGGPVYAFNAGGVTAVGIITATAGVGPNENPNDCFYTSVPDLLPFWGVSILKG